MATSAAVTVLELPDLPSDLGFTEEHAMLVGSVRRWLGERSPMTSVRKLIDDPIGYDVATFRELAGMGLFDVAALDRLHLALVFEEMGRVLYPSPYFTTILALDVLRAAGMTSLVERISSGETIASFALSEELTTTSDGKQLTGTSTHVLFGASANVVLVPCREAEGGGVGIYAVDLPCERAKVTSEIGVDRTRRTARIELDCVKVDRSMRLEGDGAALLRRASLLGAVLLAAEMCGAASAVLERTRSYACERKQFGRAIGSFQAVKHPIVDMLVGVELARSLALGAAAQMKHPDAQPAEIPARMAKAYAGDVLAYAVKKGVQLHGGFGFTWDCDVHLYFKRMLFSRAMLGDGTHHRAELGKRLFG
jgi:alkylation response protein AidB-like acyl-CoA dehydrogenase